MRSKSRTIGEKPEFRALLARCEVGLVSLFDRLRELAIISSLCDDWGYTDKPDFRMCWEHIICEMCPKPGNNSVLVMLRIDRIPIDQFLPTLHAIAIQDVEDNSLSKPGMRSEDRSNPDSRWIRFVVNNSNQLPDAVALIAHVFAGRRVIGW